MTDLHTAYIVFDIETIPDGKLIADVLYPGEAIDPDQARERLESEALDASGGKSSFVPLSFQIPAAIAVARVGADFRLQKVVCLDAPAYRHRTMVELFFKGLALYPDAALVDFGGRTFDLPVLELAAFRWGIPIPAYFAGADGKTYRHRYTGRHLDLMDWFTNHGTYRLRGGLNLMAKLIGKPGKMELKGDQVAELWRRGEKDRIGAYCMCDVLDTYFVFLRSRVMTGELAPDEEQRIEAHARALIEDLSFDSPDLEEYLARCAPPEAP